jgi:hypothetical protein
MEKIGYHVKTLTQREREGHVIAKADWGHGSTARDCDKHQKLSEGRSILSWSPWRAYGPVNTWIAVI